MICCALCHQEYRAEGLKQPNALSCGHSFCRQCIEVELGKGTPIRCPSCYAYTEEGSITPNYVIIQIVSGGAQMQNFDNVLTPPTIVCQSCKGNEATIRCFQCQPNGFLFCEQCWEKEHDRDFPPVRQHEKRLISEIPESIPPRVIHCEIHPEKVVTLFSFRHQRFACNLCTSNPQFPTEDYQSISDALVHLRKCVATRLDSLQQYLLNAGRAIESIGDMLNGLDVDANNMTEKLRNLFSDFEVNLKRRKVQLESMIDNEFACRRRMLEEQREGMEVSIGHANSKIANAKVLLQKHDLTTLQEGTEMMSTIDKLLQEGNETYLKPSADNVLPFYVDESFNDTIDRLGIIGGGAVPSNVQCNMIKGGLYLQWSLVSERTPIIEYELEYEAINTETTPQKVLINPAPDDCLHRVDGLSPGFSYCFRLRSRNSAGFGIWSHPVIGSMTDFPLEIGCTGDFMKLRIPYAGTFRITVRGAKAADGQAHTGGRGAIVTASFYLDANSILEILAGGMSQLMDFGSSGGAGGSFVLLSPANGRRELLIAAGGGGGAGGMDSQDRNGYDANTEEHGFGGAGADAGAGGVDGNAGGDAKNQFGYGGAGYMESSTAAFCLMHRGYGGKDGGGFGGGASAAKQGAGGGGGYSGGGGGRGGGGGGSYVHASGMDVEKTVGHMSDGSVLIVATDILPSTVDYFSSHTSNLDSM